MSIEVWIEAGYTGVLTNSSVLRDGLHAPITLQTQTIVPRQRWFFPSAWR